MLWPLYTPKSAEVPAFGARVPEVAPCPEIRTPSQAFDIDEFNASPWIGLHYRHEFLLHHRHELLAQEQHVHPEAALP